MDNLINELGQIIRWPTKLPEKTFVINFLATKFHTGRTYTEKEINEIVDASHLFDDIALLRRELISRKKLDRKIDGSEYWKIQKPNQRVGSQSNTYVGIQFELTAQHYFSTLGINLKRGMTIPIGSGGLKGNHQFDLGCQKQKILVECKSHKWTITDKVPSAKLAVWNEAMYYFHIAPKEYRKIMFVLRDYSQKRKKTLVEYYFQRYPHLIPDDVEFFEFDEKTEIVKKYRISDFGNNTDRDFPERELIKGFEGGAVYAAHQNSKYYIIIDESTMAMFLDEKDLPDNLIKILEFDSLSERNEYLKKRGWD